MADNKELLSLGVGREGESQRPATKPGSGRLVRTQRWGAPAAGILLLAQAGGAVLQRFGTACLLPEA